MAGVVAVAAAAAGCGGGGGRRRRGRWRWRRRRGAAVVEAASVVRVRRGGAIDRHGVARRWRARGDTRSLRRPAATTAGPGLRDDLRAAAARASPAWPLPRASAAVAPGSRPTSAAPSGGRSAGTLASDSSATAASVRRRVGAERATGGGSSCSWRRTSSTALVRLEREPPRQHPVEDHAERVDVARGRGPSPEACSGDMYAAVPSSVPASVSVSAAAHAGDAEVGDLGAAFLVEEDVRPASGRGGRARARARARARRRSRAAIAPCLARPAAAARAESDPRACLRAGARRP